MKKTFIPDEKQQAVIDFNNGYAVVLAAPGCGKTECLSQRILKAHQIYGISYSDMLCVTFTNRASRDMKDKVKEVVGDVMGELFVGNLHRFCINFLYDNNIVPIDTGILDDVDQNDVLAEMLNTTEPKSWDVKGILDYSCKLMEEELEFPIELLLHKNAPYTDYYGRVQYHTLATQYRQFKKDNKVIDFDDILYLTYDALRNPNYREDYIHSAYKWIQVDEVQDLNPLQLSIIDKLTAPDFHSVVFLGDERQAIYSFLGTKKDSISTLSKKCNGKIIYLSNNYRAPIYLLDMLNDYATEELKIESDKLPKTSNNLHLDDALTIVKCYDESEQYNVVSTLVRQIYNEAEDEGVGILVRANKDADAISEILKEHKIEHLKITNKDMFKTVNFKTLYSHFSVVTQDTRFSEWSRLLYQTHAIPKISDARTCVRKMRKIGITPLDLLDYDESSYFIEFAKTYGNKEIVVFDTETTGLNVFTDDIIQIAAMKVKNGVLVPGSELDIIIETDKQIPETLKDGYPNPMVKEYERRKNGIRNNHFEYFLTAQEAFEMFVNYIGDDELLGHNVNYDVHILENNLRRRTSGIQFTTPTFWDTLKISRMLDPNLRKHNLEGLLEIYGLEGVNSHNALDDIKATKSLMSYCYSKILPLIQQQKDFLYLEEIKRVQKRLLKNYYPLYKHTKDKLYSPNICDENTFDYEFKYIYDSMLEKNYIKAIERFDYMCALFDKVVIDKEKDIYFNQQLVNHLYEFRTFNEADLYQNGIIKERIHIMTIHKSKGLEFDNVLIYNVSSGVFPHYRSKTPDEDARVLYVGMSRAKKRIYITYEGHISQFIDKHDKVKEHFYDMPEGQKLKLLKFEEKFVKFSM